MREIKFRAWIKESWNSGSQKWVKKKMIYNAWPFIEGKVCLPDSGIGFANEPEYELMQYTGLKDKSGVEIYEGDIIYRSSNDEYLRVVFSNLGCWKFENNDFQYYTINMNVKNGSLLTCEVIGNIYENPELLKGNLK